MTILELITRLGVGNTSRLLKIYLTLSDTDLTSVDVNIIITEQRPLVHYTSIWHLRLYVPAILGCSSASIYFEATISVQKIHTTGCDVTRSTPVNSRVGAA